MTFFFQNALNSRKFRQMPLAGGYTRNCNHCYALLVIIIIMAKHNATAPSVLKV